jgi:hypothetical protein
MYKQFKLTKRYSIAFNKFSKSAKEIKLKIPAYHTGICKSTDVINEFDTYFFILGTFRVMFYIKHKHQCGITFKSDYYF